MYNKAEILDNILDTFLKYGIKSVSINDLCRIIGIPKQEIYKLFKNKDDIVEQVLLLHIDNIKQIIYKYESISECTNCISILLDLYDESIDLFSRAEPVFYHNLSKYYSKLFAMLYDFRDSYYLPFIKRIILKGIEAGVFMKSIDIDLALYSQMHLFSLLFNSNLQLNSIDNITAEKVLYLITTEIRGITTLEGHKSLDAIISQK